MSRAIGVAVVALLWLSGCSTGSPDRDASRPSPAATQVTTVATATAGLRAACPKVKAALPTLTASRNRVLSHRAFGYRVIEISQDADEDTQRSLADLVSSSLLYSRRDLAASDQAFLEALDDVAAQCKVAGSRLL